MGNDDSLKRYLDMGMALTQTLGATAEGLVKELIKTGESPRVQVDDLFDRGRRSTEDLIDVLRREISTQLGQLVSDVGLVTKADLADLEARLAAQARPSAAPPTEPPSAEDPAAGSTASKSTASKSTASKRSPRKAAPAAKATTRAAKAAPRPAGAATKSAKATKSTKATKRTPTPRPKA